MLYVCPGGVERIPLSYNEKFKKKKTRLNVESEEEEQTPSSPVNDHHKKRSILSKKSFHKVAKLVKLSRSVSAEKKSEEVVDGIPEEDEEGKKEGEGEQGTPPPPSPSPRQPSSPQRSPETNPRKKRPPPRPNAIVLKEEDTQLALDNPIVTLTPSDPSTTMEVGGSSSEYHDPLTPQTHHHHKEKKRGGSRFKKERDYPTVVKGGGEDGEDLSPSQTAHSPHRLTTRSRSSRLPRATENEDFFVINYIQMSVCGLWLCMGNKGGYAMVFNFSTTNSKQSTPCKVSEWMVWRVQTLSSALEKYVQWTLTNPNLRQTEHPF